MPVKIQVPLPPYIVKDPKDYEAYRNSARAKFLISLGCFRNVKDQHIDVTIKHLLYVNEWQPMVFTDTNVWSV